MSIQRKKSQQLYRLAKTDCWSDADVSRGNDVENQSNYREIPYQILGRSTLQYFKGKAPNFDTVALPKGENGLEEIII